MSTRFANVLMTAAPAAALADSGSNGVSDKAFSVHMAAMREMYSPLGKSGSAATIYPLPINVHGYKLSPLAQEQLKITAAKGALQAAARASQNKLTGLVGNIQSGVQVATANLQASKDMNAFHEEMEQQRQDALAQANDAINIWFDNAEKYGMDSSELRSEVMTTSNGFGAFVGNIVNKIKEFFSTIIDWIKQAVQDVIDWIEQAAQKVADFVSNAIDAVGNAASDLFGWL